MKIGIITVHSVPNYGALLQAYGLVSYLRERGLDAETIDYRQPDLADVYRMRWSFPPRINQWLRLRRCEQFVQRLPLSPRRYSSVEEFIPDAARYDTFITGSDQVWSTAPVQCYDRMYFLDFPAAGSRKLSYAASVGGTTDFAEYTDRVRRAVGALDHIGVRDRHTASLVEPFARQPMTQTFDPVFLHDFRELLSAEPPIPQPYLAVFGDFNRGLAPVVPAVARSLGLETIVSLQYPCAAATRRVPAPGPVEWLNWLHHSAFVLTSYFHGTVVAVKFQRPFISVPTRGRRLKVSTLLEPLGLSSRCFADAVDPAEAAARATQPIDWSRSAAELSRQRDQSVGFLERALSLQSATAKV